MNLRDRSDAAGRHDAAAEPPSAEEARPWEAAAGWILRGAVILTAVFHFVWGSVLYGLFSLAAVAVVVVPLLLARTHRATIPVELELLLLVFVLGDTLLGKLLGLYERLAYYDKLLHFHNSVLLALVAFLFVYALHYTGRLRTSAWMNALVILLVTLGAGAFWEILEYTADRFFEAKSQGSPTMGPLDDTMWDLVLDGLGGLVGASLGALYMRYSRRSRRRIAHLAFHLQ